ncbi:MAG: hypothetical protein U1E65_27455 [Myxococcota bacterium]
MRFLVILTLGSLFACAQGGGAAVDGASSVDAGLAPEVGARDATGIADATIAADAGADAAADAGADATIAADAMGEGDAMPDVDAAAGDAGPKEPWDVAYCRAHACTFIRQNEPGADDQACNGSSPSDLGTVDAMGLRDCPWRSLQGRRLHALLHPSGGPAHGRTIFIGEGRYPVWPSPLELFGDGTNADEALVLTSFRGEQPELTGGSCPAACTLETETGTVSRSPCCAIRCPSCDADPRCVPIGDGCGIPWDKTPTILTVAGQWVRVEGLRLDGCFSDALVVAARDRGTLQSLIPNDHLYVVNNEIHGCDVNENIKAYREGPGPSAGGPVWGPVEIVGNDLSEMASQGVDATGVHHWFVEDNYLHDAKTGSFMGTGYDGGGIGFKNGGTQARVRNNWSASRGGGFGLGGTSASCARDTSAPAGYGCFQRYEMSDLRVENNTVLNTSADALRVYSCGDCQLRGNVIDGLESGSHLRIQDDCPGPNCPPHNPGLLASRNLYVANNAFRGGNFRPEGPYFLIYSALAHPNGPSAEGMRSVSNQFCAAPGVSPAADPAGALLLFGHVDPAALFPLADYAAQIGDTGSEVFNPPGAPSQACPALAAINLVRATDHLSWSAPPAATRCTLSVDEVERQVPCAGTATLSASPGRHYASLEAEGGGGGMSSATSWVIGAAGQGASCAIALDGDQIRFRSDGDRCQLRYDGPGIIDAGGACQGNLQAPPALLGPGRHRLVLSVRDSRLGQTACSAVLNR